MEGGDGAGMRETPSNRPAEEAVISCILSGASPFLLPLREQHFFSPDLQLIFHACSDLADRGIRPDLMAVTAELQSCGRLDDAGGPGAVADLLRAETSNSGEAVFRYYFEQLEGIRQTRDVYCLAKRLLPDLPDRRVTAADFVAKLGDALGASATCTSQSAEELLQDMKKEEGNSSGTPRMRFGIPKLDHFLDGGVLPGELFVLAGDTGTGKTAGLIQICAEAALSDVKALYFSLEMKNKEVFKRLASASFSTAQKCEDFSLQLERAAQLPVSFRDDLSDLADIRAAISSAVRAKGIKLVIVDYLQLVNDKAETRELAMSNIARTLKSVALREDVALVTASQVNEDGRLRESRAIGHHADAVLGVDKSGIFVNKFRRGPSGAKFPCTLNGSLSRFEE